MTVTRILRRPRILVVGCGDVGLRCVERLRGRSRVIALTSQPSRRASLRAAGAVPLVGDLDVRASLARLAGLAPTVLHLAPPQKSGNDDRRTQALIATLTARQRSPARPAPHSPARRGAAQVSRRFLQRTSPAVRPRGMAAAGPLRGSGSPPPGAHAAACAGASSIVPDRGFATVRGGRPCLRIVYASTTGVYGDCGGARIVETRPPNPVTPRAKRRVAAERRLRRATARGALSATVARIPGIYAANRLPHVCSVMLTRMPLLAKSEPYATAASHTDKTSACRLAGAGRGRS